MRRKPSLSRAIFSSGQCEEREAARKFQALRPEHKSRSVNNFQFCTPPFVAACDLGTSWPPPQEQRKTVPTSTIDKWISLDVRKNIEKAIDG